MRVRVGVLVVGAGQGAGRGPGSGSVWGSSRGAGQVVFHFGVQVSASRSGCWSESWSRGPGRFRGAGQIPEGGIGPGWGYGQTV